MLTTTAVNGASALYQGPDLLTKLPTDLLRFVLSFLQRDSLEPTVVALPFVCRKFREIHPKNSPLVRSLFLSMAARKGYFDLLKWGMPIRPRLRMWDSHVGQPCIQAARKGDFEMIMWLKEKGFTFIQAAPATARKGNLELLKKLSVAGCRFYADVSCLAAAKGHLHVLKWLKANDLSISYMVSYNAIASGDTAILEWYDQNVCKVELLTCRYGFRKGNIASINWWLEKHLQHFLSENPTPTLFDESDFEAAAEGGNTDILELLKKHNTPWNARVCSAAAKTGKLPALQWLRARGAPWNEETCNEAARNNHLNVLKWARLESCPWSVNTFKAAAEGGHINILEWLLAESCPWNETCYTGAAEKLHLQVLDWLKSKECPSKQNLHISSTISPVIYNWLKVHGLPGIPLSEEDEREFIEKEDEKKGYFFCDQIPPQWDAENVEKFFKLAEMWERLQPYYKNWLWEKAKAKEASQP